MQSPPPLPTLAPLPSSTASPQTAQLLRATDWSATALGPMEHWPQSLRLALGICLHSRFPMFVWWGPQLINLYNDAYLPILGKRHPAAFGRPAREVWGEIWDVVGPQAEAAMRRGEASWNERVKLVMERHGYSEETWFTWSYSPIPDESGGIGGVFCACTEETPRVLVEQQRDRLIERVQSERARLEDAFVQAPSFMAVLSGPGHVFEFVNERYRQLIGGRDVVGQAVAAAMPEVVGQGFIEVLDRVFHEAEPFIGTDVPIELQRRSGRPLETRYVDFVYLPMRDAEGGVSGVLVHGVDITERRLAELRDRFLVALDDAVRPLVDADAIVATCARLLGEHLQADRCAYAEVDDDGGTFDVTGDYTRGVPGIVGRYPLRAVGEHALALMRRGGAYVVEDIDREQPPPADLPACHAAGIRAVICVPLLKSGRFVAGMAMHQAAPRAWSAADVELVRHVAARCWESIERARVARELRLSERRFRVAASTANSIIWTNSADGRMAGEQIGWGQFTGQAPEQYQGYGWAEALHPDDREPTLRAWFEAVAGERRFDFQHRVRRADGVYRVCSVHAVPVRDDAGRIREWVGVHRDISERIDFEQHLRESEQRFRTMSDQAPVMIWLTDADGQCEYVNRQWCDFTGQDAAQALGRGWLEALHPQDRPLAIEAFEAASARAEPFSLEYRLRRGDGAIRWCVVTGTPRQGPRDGVIGYIGSVIDITDRRRTELALAAEKRVLERMATGAPLAQVLDTLARSVETQSAEGLLCSVLLLDEAGERLRHGAAPRLPAAYNAAIDGLRIGPAVGSCGTAAYEDRLVCVTDIASDPLWRDYRALALEHDLAACTSTPVYAGDGRVLGTIALYYRTPRAPGDHDLELARMAAHLAGVVIEKHQIDQRLHLSLQAEQDARADAERASRMKDDFLATLSHELRTPLNAILGWVGILRYKQAIPPDLAQGVDVIERNARAQAQIIQDLLDMSAIISGKVHLQTQPVDLHALALDAVEAFRPTAEGKHVRLESVVDGALGAATIEGDPNRLQQVLWNLLSNAVKFTPRDGRIEVRLARIGTALELAVADSGEGIDADFLPHVFDRFRQADASISRRHGGLGLGLSIVMKLVELHGGTVAVTSDGRWQGACFTVTLPLARALASTATNPAAPTTGAGATPTHPLRGLRVLVVDDDADARLMTRRLLEEYGAAVETADSAASAMATLQQQRFDVLLSDIGMPGEDGYALMRRVRGLHPDRGGAVPAVALTAYAAPEDRLRAIAAGFQQHVPKPVEPSELVAVLAGVAADG